MSIEDKTATGKPERVRVGPLPSTLSPGSPEVLLVSSYDHMRLWLLSSGSQGAELRSRHPDLRWKAKLNTTEMQGSQFLAPWGRRGQGTEPLSRPLGSGQAWLLAAWTQEGLESPPPCPPCDSCQHRNS